MTDPLRMIIEPEYAADGVYWVSTEAEARAWLRTRQPGTYMPPLSQELRGDLKAWNQSWERADGFWDDAEARRAWEERALELAIRAQNELGAGWEVLYHMDGRVHRVHPPGSWPAETWEQELLGYPSRDRDLSVAAVVFTCQPKIAAAIDITKGPCVPAPGKRRPVVPVQRQHYGDRPEHLTALYQLLTDQPEAGAWSDVTRAGEAMLATFSGDYRSALASLRSGQQDDQPDKLVEFAIRWEEVTEWPSQQLPAGLSRSRLVGMVGCADKAIERQTPLYCWFGPAQPSRTSQPSRQPKSPSGAPR